VIFFATNCGFIPTKEALDLKKNADFMLKISKKVNFETLTYFSKFDSIKFTQLNQKLDFLEVSNRLK